MRFRRSWVEWASSLLRPRILYRYVLLEFLKSFLLALVACTLLFLLVVLVGAAMEWETLGISIGKVAFAAPYFLPFSLTYTLPLAAMIAAILVFGRLTADHEILAAQSGGASISLLGFPIIVCGFLLSFVTFWCNDSGIAWGFGKLYSHILTLENPQLREMLNKPGNSVAIHLDKSGMLQVNMLPLVTENGKTRAPIHVSHFERGHLKLNLFARDHKFGDPELRENEDGFKMNVKLYGGQTLGDDPYFFKNAEFSLDLPSLSSQFKQGSGHEGLMHNLAEARQIRDSIKVRRQYAVEQAADLAAQWTAGSTADPTTAVMAAAGWTQTLRAAELASSAKKKIRQKLVEFHRKLSLSFMPFCLVFLGIGLGLMVRKSNRLVGFISGVLAYFLIYYPLMITFKELANSGTISPIWLWSPNAFVVFGGWLCKYLYERGIVAGGAPQWTFGVRSAVQNQLVRVWKFLLGIKISVLLPFKKKIDRHVAGSFMLPLLAVSLAVGVLIVLLDLLEHGNEVVRGITLANKPLLWLEKRNLFEAFWDVGVYYGIRAVDTLFYLLPALILLAGVLAVTVMVRNNEHLIAKSSGTRLQRVFLPILLLCAIFSVGASLVRETIMPDMIMRRDQLKPYIYHRSPKSKSLAGQSENEHGETVIFEISQYSRNLHRCEGLRIYLPEGAPEGQFIPRLLADSAIWDQDQRKWILRTVHKGGAITDQSFNGSQTRYNPYGLKRISHPDEPGLKQKDIIVPEWSGQLSPAFLESKQLGPAVMPFTELMELSHYPEFASELWRRPFDWLTGILLLMVCIPLLASQEVKSPFVGIAKCITFGALYLGLNMGVSEAARQELIFSAAPILPHLFFLGLGVWQYFFRMET